MTIYGYRLPPWLALLIWAALWEIIGQLDVIMLIPPLSAVFAAMGNVLLTHSFLEAIGITLKAFGIGMALSLVVGITVGIAMGRIRAVDNVMGMWINIFESSPITAVVPLLLAVLGFGMQTMVVTVFLFSVWVIALDTQVGVKHASASLVEMARSFGASKRDLYAKVIFWAALPEMLAGIRLGVIRGVRGVVIGQLLIAIVGVGFLFETYSRKFIMPEFWALVLIVFGFAYGLRRRSACSSAASRATPACVERTPGQRGPWTTSFPRRRSWPAGRGRRAALPGAPGVLRRAQLRRACPRDGTRPRPRAAVLLHQARGRPGPGRRHDPLSAGDQRPAPRGRAGGRARQGRRRHTRGAGPRSRVRLRRRHRSDPARSPGRGQGAAPALGHGQGLRPLRAHLGAAPAARIGHPENNPIRLEVNGAVRQESTLAHHIWSVAETIAYLSTLVELAPGDLIFMGTPEGVAAVGRGDVLEASIAGVGDLRVAIVRLAIAAPSYSAGRFSRCIVASRAAIAA